MSDPKENVLSAGFGDENRNDPTVQTNPLIQTDSKPEKEVFVPGSKKSLQAVIFDMDGLMIDSERVTFEGYVELCAKEGKVLDEPTYLLCLGKPVKGIHQVFYDAFGDDFPIPEIMKQNHIRMAKQFQTKGVPVKEGLRELLEKLHEHNIACLVATSSNRDRVDEIFRLAGLTDDFAAVVCGNEVEHGKPAPDIFLAAAKKAGVDPESCMVLEDSESGITASYAANIPVVCIPDMKQPEEEFSKKCAAILPSLNDVIGWLDL